MEKFIDRKEQREVVETMNSLLSPMIDYLNEDTAARVKRALHLLSEIGIGEPGATRFECFSDNELKKMESAFRSEGLIYLCNEVRAEMESL